MLSPLLIPFISVHCSPSVSSSFSAVKRGRYCWLCANKSGPSPHMAPLQHHVHSPAGPEVFFISCGWYTALFWSRPIGATHASSLSLIPLCYHRPILSDDLRTLQCNRRPPPMVAHPAKGWLHFPSWPVVARSVDRWFSVIFSFWRCSRRVWTFSIPTDFFSSFQYVIISYANEKTDIHWFIWVRFGDVVDYFYDADTLSLKTEFALNSNELVWYPDRRNHLRCRT